MRRAQRLAMVMMAAAAVLAASAHPAFRDAPAPAAPANESAVGINARQLPVAVEGPGRLYRWRDGRGVVNVSTEATLAPPHARAVDLPAPIVAAAAVPGLRAAGELAGILEGGPLAVYTADGLAALMADAGRVAARLQERRELLERLRVQL